MLIKRIFDLVFSLFGIVLLSPVFLFISLWIMKDDGLPIFFVQKRIGLNEKSFGLYKFRSMFKNAESKGQLTVGNTDPRITRSGYWIRKYKLDELPQLFNVARGEMSLVGPRPEVLKYVQLYDENQKRVLSVKPGITDIASIEFSNENEILSAFPDPEKAYIRELMPKKLDLNLQYIENQSFLLDLTLIYRTLHKIIK
jgi:lipopolysaccharide/colanic/teichoic acid biosynthesis glycosyltransferase